MKIVVVGGVGSGKSTVSGLIYQALGMSEASIEDVDSMVRDIYAFPEDYFDGAQLERWKEILAGGPLRDRIFQDPTLRKEVEDLTSPHVYKKLETGTGYDFRIIEFPLFFEKSTIQSAAKYDVIVRVTAPEALRRKRCADRGWSKESIDGVFKAQASDEDRDNFIFKLRDVHPNVHVITIDSSFPFDQMVEQVLMQVNHLKKLKMESVRTDGTKIGVLGGSFDPITKGHEHVIKEALRLMDYVVIAIAKNPGKKYMFTDFQRAKMITLALKDLTDHGARVFVQIVPDDELLASWANDFGANTLFRGIRTGTDLEYEQTIQFVQNKVAPSMSMVHILPPRDLLEVSSSLIRNSLHLRQWESIVHGYVSEGVFNFIRNNR
jgi:pantetheine-phosphate adenylyltransferase